MSGVLSSVFWAALAGGIVGAALADLHARSRVEALHTQIAILQSLLDKD